MKFKFLYFCIGFSLLALLLMSSSGGRALAANDGNTGAPGESGTVCMNCHNSGSTTFGTIIETLDIYEAGTSIPVSNYSPNTAYDVVFSVSTSTGTPGGYGFQMTALDVANTNTGTWQNLGANVQSATASNVAGRTYVEQGGGFSTSNTFNMQWVAPAAGSGDVTFYYIGNAVNANFTTTGDLGGTGNSMTIMESSLACTTPVVSTFPYTENFDVLVPNNAGVFACITTDNLTDCWINDPVTLNTNMWTARSSSTGSGNTGPSADHTSGTGNYVFLEGSSCFSMVSYMYGPVLDVSTLTTPTLTFWYHMWGADMGTLEVEASTDGVTYAPVWSLSGDQGNAWIEQIVALPAYAGATTLSLRFKGTTGTAFTTDIGVDDITIDELPPCVDPSMLMTTGITPTTVSLGWTENGIATMWDIEYGPAGFTPGTGTTVAAGTNPFTVTGLTPSTGYDFYVNSDCGVDGLSAQHGPASAVTQPLCPEPTMLVATNVTDIAALIGWTENGTSTMWNVEYGPSGFTPGMGTTVAASTNPLMVSGLTASTGYDFYVQADCGASGTSIVTGPITVVTQCPPLTAPILEDFEAAAGSVPTCWRNFGNETWEFNTFDGHVGNAGATGDHTTGSGYFANIEDSTPDNLGTTLQTPLVDISGLANPVLSFWLLSDNEGFSNVDFSVNIWDGTMWVPNVFTSNTNTGGWAEVVIPLTGYVGPVMATFVGDEVVAGDFYDDVAIDDIEFKEAPTCPTPSGLMATNITGTSADLNWTENGTASMWNIEYGLAGFAQGAGTTVAVAAPSPYNLTGLTPVTAYDFYVQADCGANGLSAWAGPSSFTTPCMAFTPAYLEDFTTFAPACWDEANSGDPTIGPMAIGTGEWIADGFGSVGTTGAARINLYNLGTEDWLLSPQFDLSVPGPWELVFDIALTEFNNTNPTTLGSDDEVQLLVSTDGGATWVNMMTWNASTPISNTGDQIIFPLAAYTGTTQFAFWGWEGTVDDPEDNDFFVDNFQIRMPPACTNVTNLTVTNVLDTEALLSWTGGGSESLWNLEYGPIGFTPGSGTMVNGLTTTTYQLTGLMPATGYDYYVVSDCNPGLGNAIGPVTFVTQCAALMAPYFEDFEAAAGAVPTCWRNFGNGETWIFATSGGHVGNAGATGDHTTGSGYFAYVDDSNPPQGIGTTLQTPLVDVTSLANPVLCFWVLSDNEGNTNVDFSVNVWDGAAWVPNVYTSNTNTGGWLQVTIPLSSLTITGPVMATFVVDETNGTDFYDDLAIDDVAFKEAPPCPAPSALTATNITETSADLSWTSTETLWNVEYGVSGFAKGTGTGVSTTTNPHALTGLTPGTTYDYYVQTDCGGPIADLVITGVGDGPLTGGQPKIVELYAVNDVPDLGIYGLESANNGGGANAPEYTFPAGVTVAAGTFIYITGDSARFNEFFGFDADYIDGPSTGVNGDDAIVLYESGAIIDVAGDPNMDGTGTAWDYLDGWMSRASATNNDGMFVIGDWTFSGINVFDGQMTNATSPTPFPVGVYIPPVSACVGPYTFTTLLGCGGNYTDSGGPAGDYSSNETDSVTICPDIVGEVVSVTFTFFSTENSGTGCWDGLSIYDGDDDTDTPINAPTGGAVWCWDRDDATPTGSGDLQGMTITSTDVSGCLTFVFTSDGSAVREGWEAMVTCAPPPPCPAPTALTAANITDSSADLSWMSMGTAWNVEYGVTGFAKGTGTGVATTTNPHALTGLAEQTTYDYYVQNDCGGPIADLIITGLTDGPLPVGNPKSVELYAVNDIPDLGIYGLESVNFAGGPTAPEFTFPAGVAVPQGTFLYVARDSAEFNNFFGFDADYIDIPSTLINGDDAVVLFENGAVIDVAGDPNVDGTGTPWEYTDGWIYRNSLTTNSGTFAVGDWTFSGRDVFDGQTTNATSPTPFPIGSYVAPVSACAGPFTFTTLCSPFVGDSLADPIMIPALPFVDTSTTAACFTNSLGNASPDAFYQFTTGPCTDSVTVSLCGSSYDTFLRLFDATGTMIASNDDACSTQSEIVEAVMPNATYTIAVEGYLANSGDFVLNVSESLNPVSAAVDAVTAIACNGDSSGAIMITTTNGVAPYTYSWSNGATTEDLTGLTAGSYTGTITDVNGCTLVAGPVMVTEPTAITLAVDAVVNASCNGDSDGSISITPTGGTAPYTYSWSNGASTEDVAGLAPGSYTGTITDANGCTLAAGPVVITEPAALGFTADGFSGPSCAGGADGFLSITTTGGTAPYTYIWSNGATTEDISGLVAGNYGGTITDANGCVVTGGPLPLSGPSPIQSTVLTVGEGTLGASDGSIDLMVSGGTAPYTYVWNNGETTEDIAGLAPGVYCVTITDANGCLEDICGTIASGVSGTNEITNLSEFNLSPNPTSSVSELTLGFSTPVDLNVQVVNVLGQVIFEEGDTKVLSKQYNLDLTKYAAGTYFVRVRVDGQTATKQLIVTK